jgi:hypothetical protein
VEKNLECFNIITAGVLWGLWLVRNDMIFRDQHWQDIKMVLRKIWRCMSTCKPMYKESLKVGATQWCNFLESKLKVPLEIDYS